MWHKVNKKTLPPVNHTVIGYTNRGRMLFTWVDGGTKVFDDQDISSDDGEKYTHWRRKPLPPKS